MTGTYSNTYSKEQEERDVTTQAHDAGSLMLAPPDPVLSQGVMPGALLALQLTARGYSRGQLGSLLGKPESMVDLLLEQAAAGMGVDDVHGAVMQAISLRLVT